MKGEVEGEGMGERNAESKPGKPGEGKRKSEREWAGECETEREKRDGEREGESAQERSRGHPGQ